MRGKSFSGRLSWRIIGIVSVISIIAQIAVFVTFKWLQDTPVMHLVMLAIGLASLAAIFFACRAVIAQDGQWQSESRVARNQERR